MKKAGDLHQESASRGQEYSDEQKRVFRREAAWMQEKWGEKLARDPYYNPNLSLDEDGGFTLAWPARLPALSASLNAVTGEILSELS